MRPVLVFIHVHMVFLRANSITFIHYIQDVTHNNNFDNIFISLGFSHKLTVFYDGNNPAECNEQHGFFYIRFFFFFSNYYCRGLPEHNSNVTVSRAPVSLYSLSKLCKNFSVYPMAVRIQNKMASIFI